MKKTEYAGLGSRITALLIDIAIIGLPVIIVAAQVFSFMLAPEKIQLAKDNTLVLYGELLRKSVFLMVLIIVLWSLIMAYFTASKIQASPGKRIMGIYISTKDGLKASYHNLFARFASLPLFILLIQYFERKNLYVRLDEAEKNLTGFKSVEEYIMFLNKDHNDLMNLVVFAVILLWLLLPSFTKQKTAFHDILFDTRVVYGKK